MLTEWEDWVARKADAGRLLEATPVQELWNGYGELLRLRLEGGSFILKRVVWPTLVRDSVSDQRKRRSYQVEQAFYREVAPELECRVANCIAQEWGEQGCLLLLEDLAASGYQPDRDPSPRRTEAGLAWLALFHARFLGREVPGLWEQGCYWHLDTRRQEWDRMPEGPLKEHASAIDQRLKGARYQTLTHGDAKVPNFCWDSRDRAAAVDFQYVGKGPGIRDVALFLDRCLDREGCHQAISYWLDVYFALLESALEQPSGPVEREWRELFPIAWADYSRFFQGWAMRSDLDSYSAKQLELALKSLS